MKGLEALMYMLIGMVAIVLIKLNLAVVEMGVVDIIVAILWGVIALIALYRANRLLKENY